MPDIFISYSQKDEQRIRPFVNALEDQGWSVFWDRRIPAGQTWRSHTGKALEEARCVIVAWSTNSIASEWVIEEADKGKQRRILVPVRIDNVDPPLGFGGIQAADLINWQLGRQSTQFDLLVKDIMGVLRTDDTSELPKEPLVPESDATAPQPLTTDVEEFERKKKEEAKHRAVTQVSQQKRINIKPIYIGISIGLIFLIALVIWKPWINLDKEAFLQAHNANTIETYEAFITDNPKSAFIQAARDSIDSIKEKEAFGLAMIAMNETEWDSFKQQFPGSKLYEKADYYVDSLVQDSVFALCERKEDFEAYLAQYPEGFFVAQARNKIDNFINLKADEEAWNQAERNGNIDGYNEYLKENPDGNYKTQAQAAIHKIKNSFTDPDGKIYKVAKIDNQVWMAENLAYKPSKGNYWPLDDDPSNIARYGYLYDWETAKNVCPTGWRLPTKSDFETLLSNSNFGGDHTVAYKGLIQGGSSGFTALFGGWRYGRGTFDSEGGTAFFWSSSAYYSLHIDSYSRNATLSNHDKSWGFSVRCLQDN